MSYSNRHRSGQWERIESEVFMNALAAALGMTICLMLAANAALQQALGPGGALVVVHLVGLGLALPLAWFVKAPPRVGPGPVPWPLFAGGLVGLVLLVLNNQTVPALGTGLTVALGIAGQLGASAAIDTVGFFGLPRRPLAPRRVVGLGLTVVGIGVMTWGRVAG